MYHGGPRLCTPLTFSDRRAAYSLSSFVTFEDESAVQKVFDAGQMHELGGKQVEVKNATPKGSGPQSAGRGTGGGGRGAPGLVAGGRGYAMSSATAGGRGYGQYGQQGYGMAGYAGECAVAVLRKVEDVVLLPPLGWLMCLCATASRRAAAACPLAVTKGHPAPRHPSLHARQLNLCQSLSVSANDSITATAICHCQ